MYQDESTNVSMVSVSRRAGPPHCGQSTSTHDVAAARGDWPLGASCSPLRSVGRVTGSWSSGTSTSPQSGQWTTGIGVPQKR